MEGGNGVTQALLLQKPPLGSFSELTQAFPPSASFSDKSHRCPHSECSIDVKHQQMLGKASQKTWDWGAGEKQGMKMD